jgi:hypothetical protein
MFSECGYSRDTHLLLMIFTSTAGRQQGPSHATSAMNKLYRPVHQQYSKSYVGYTSITLNSHRLLKTSFGPADPYQKTGSRIRILSRTQMIPECILNKIDCVCQSCLQTATADTRHNNMVTKAQGAARRAFQPQWQSLSMFTKVHSYSQF